MTLKELRDEVTRLYNTIEDDCEFCELEYDTVMEYCYEHKWNLTDEAIEYLETLGYDYPYIHHIHTEVLA